MNSRVSKMLSRVARRRVTYRGRKTAFRSHVDPDLLFRLGLREYQNLKRLWSATPANRRHALRKRLVAMNMGLSRR